LANHVRWDGIILAVPAVGFTTLGIIGLAYGTSFSILTGTLTLFAGASYGGLSYAALKMGADAIESERGFNLLPEITVEDRAEKLRIGEERLERLSKQSMLFRIGEGVLCLGYATASGLSGLSATSNVPVLVTLSSAFAVLGFYRILFRDSPETIFQKYKSDAQPIISFFPTVALTDARAFQLVAQVSF